jgi:aspergillopepsin I
VEKGFTCINFTEGAGYTAPESACGFGPTYIVTDTFEQIPDENFNVSYGSGDEWLNGIMGYEEVTLAGITVKTEVAIPYLASWYVKS